MQDQQMQCRDCGNEFTWTQGEQEFYQQKGFTNPPGRCPDCRRKRKMQNRGDRPMFETTCANCGNMARVPFKPTGDKPVLCRDCFQQQRSQ